MHELPLTSAQLQSCIEAKRTNTPHSSQVDALAVEQILYDFFHDAADNGANAHWLKTAPGLGQTIEDSIVLEHLRNAVSNVFTVLQSLLNNRADKGILRTSSEFVSCIALFSYLQGLES